MEVTIKEACDGFWTCLEPTDWISLISVFIAMIAAIASWLTIFSQERINKKNQEAIIFPGIKSIKANIEHILSDWDVKGRVPKKFSGTKLPIWNHGNSPVFNIRYCYYIENVEDFIYAGLDDMDEFDSHEIFVREYENEYELYIGYKNIEGKEGSQIRYLKPYLRYVDVIQPKESTNILLPDYFIIMLNDYFINSFGKNRKQKQPILNLKIIYDDVDYQTWELIFRIFIPNTFHFKNGSDLDTSFHYEVIQTKQKRKRLTVKENEKRMNKK
ncbi:hypothetical protein [Bacillus sp. JJ722]|uniref:hypothetical protein n=1 Tax=Bacillus sp. JJ722 TaxID=3122973 RepID=UPI002FFF52EC